MTIQAGYNDNAKCKDGQFNERQRIVRQEPKLAKIFASSIFLYCRAYVTSTKLIQSQKIHYSTLLTFFLFSGHSHTFLTPLVGVYLSSLPLQDPIRTPPCQIHLKSPTREKQPNILQRGWRPNSPATYKDKIITQKIS